MADTADLKSAGEQSPCGFESHLGHLQKTMKTLLYIAAAGAVAAVAAFNMKGKQTHTHNVGFEFVLEENKETGKLQEKKFVNGDEVSAYEHCPSCEAGVFLPDRDDENRLHCTFCKKKK